MFSKNKTQHKDQTTEASADNFVCHEKLERIKRDIANGEYEVNPESIADKIIQFEEHL